MVDVGRVNESQGLQQRFLNELNPSLKEPKGSKGWPMECCGVGKCCFSIAGSALQHCLGWRPGLEHDEVTITILGCSFLGEQQLPE